MIDNRACGKLLLKLWRCNLLLRLLECNLIPRFVDMQAAAVASDMTIKYMMS